MRRCQASGTPSRPGSLAGARLGPYLLCEPIGAGGMARVYLGLAPDRRGRRRDDRAESLECPLVTLDDLVESSEPSIEIEIERASAPTCV